MPRPSLHAAASAVIAAFAALLPAPAALAGWSADPVEVHATANLCSQVAVCDDGEFGAIVVWEERESYDRWPLRAAHLLATGDFDAGWPRAGTVSNSIVSRVDLQAFPDGAGGAVVTWLEGTSLCLLRVRAGGVAEGPPAGVRVIASMPASGVRPLVIADGRGGIYVGWTSVWPSVFRVLRLDADGLPRTGWSSTGRFFSHSQDEQGNPGYVACGSVARAPNDGVFVVWAGYGVDEGGMIQPGSVRVAQLGPAGLPVPGWGVVRVASFPAEIMPCDAPFGSQGWELPGMRLVDVASDDTGGAYVLRGEGAEREPDDWPGRINFSLRLHHLDATRSPAAAWPAEGRDVGLALTGPFCDLGHGASFRVWSAIDGEVVLGTGDSEGTGGPAYAAWRFDSNANRLGVMGGGALPGIEFSHSAAGVAYVASFHPQGPRGPCDWSAYAACSGSTGTWYAQRPLGLAYAYFHDVGVAALPDGGAIFAWGQFGERNGLYAVRLNSAGLVTSVPPPAAPPAAGLALRFLPGDGVRASASFAGAGEAHLLLADVAGRAVARETFEAPPGAREWTLPGTAALPPGLYFARLVRGGDALTARVVVTR